MVRYELKHDGAWGSIYDKRYNWMYHNTFINLVFAKWGARTLLLRFKDMKERKLNDSVEFIYS